MTKLPPAPSRRDCLDLLAFLSVLIAGIVLIAVGHLTAGALTSVFAACAALYAVWNHRRPSPPKERLQAER